MCDKTELNYEEISYMFIGFNFPLSRSYSKHKCINEFFEKLPEMLNTRTKQICEVMIHNGIPSLRDKRELVERLEKVLEQINEERKYSIDTLKKVISDLKCVLNTQKLYN